MDFARAGLARARLIRNPKRSCFIEGELDRPAEGTCYARAIRQCRKVGLSDYQIRRLIGTRNLANFDARKMQNASHINATAVHNPSGSGRIKR